MTADELARAVGEAGNKELAGALERIEHCLDQLSDDQIWARKQPELNSLGNVLLHLIGNVRQWIIAGLGGGADTRNRPAEFAERGPIPKHQLQAQLRAVVEDARKILGRLTAQQLLQVRRIQGFEVTGLAAIFDSIPHFRGHTQEIVYMTRLTLGKAYRFAWSPKTPEQGAPA